MQMHAACTHLLLKVMDDRLPSFSLARTAEDQGCADGNWIFAIRASVDEIHSSLVLSILALDLAKNLQDLFDPFLIGSCVHT